MYVSRRHSHEILYSRLH